MLEPEPDAGHCLFGAETLQARVDALQGEIAGVRRAEDLECVHRMRVASRRLRTALALFADCVPARRAAVWRQAIRRITRALGAARDTDVQIACVEAFATRLPDPRCRPGIARLLLRLRQRRARVQAGVEAALARLEADRTVPRMTATLRRLRARARLHPAEATASPTLAALATRAITGHLAELLSYEPYVTQPERIEELHAMRIAAKRLRYALEVFAPRVAGELKAPLKTIRAVQDALGDIHDCDVWLRALPRFLERERARATAYSGTARGVARLVAGIRALEDDRRRLRAARYRDFRALWQHTPPVWTALLEQLR